MITSFSNPRVKQVVQWQTKAKERKKDDIFLAEGVKMYEEAPEESVREVYVIEETLKKIQQDIFLWKKLQRTGYETVSTEVFQKMSDTQTPQGILTVLKRPEYQLKKLLKVKNPLFVILEDLQDPGNLGTILRTGEGAGVTAVIMSRNTVDIFNPKTIRATMGSVYRVPFLYVDSLEDLPNCPRSGTDSGAGSKGNQGHPGFPAPGQRHLLRLPYRQKSGKSICDPGKGRH